MARAIERRPTFVAWAVWLGCWTVPWLMLMRDELSGFLVTLLVVPTVAAGLIMFGVFSLVLKAHLDVGGEFDGRDARVILGLSTVPHLFLVSSMAWSGAESLRAAPLTGLPVGVGVSGAVVMAYWQSAALGELSLLPFVPAFLNIWSGVLVVVGMKQISGTSWPQITLGYGAAVVFSSLVWTFLGFPVSVFVAALSFGP